MLERLKFTQKIGLMTAIAIGGLALLVVLTVVQTQQRLVEARKELLKSSVESVYAIAVGFQARAAAGEMSVEDAQSAAAKAISTSRFGGADGRADIVGDIIGADIHGHIGGERRCRQLTPGPLHHKGGIPPFVISIPSYFPCHP